MSSKAFTPPDKPLSMKCLTCKKTVTPKDVTYKIAKNGTPMQQGKCPTCDRKLSLFISGKKTGGDDDFMFSGGCGCTGGSLDIMEDVIEGGSATFDIVGGAQPRKSSTKSSTKAASKKVSASKKTPAKKTPAKKVTAMKKASAAKTPVKKAAAKTAVKKASAPAKKASATKTPAKKVTATKKAATKTTTSMRKPASKTRAKK